MSETRNAFETIVAQLDYPMFVLTVAAGGERSGCLVGFAGQCSIDPARFFVGVSKTNHTAPIARRAEVFVVHALRAHDVDLAHLFGEETGDEVDKFARCTWHEGPHGTPVLDGVDWFAGRVLDHADWGDHTAYALDVLDDGDAAHASDAQLGFQAVRAFDPGHDA
jgi:flavin reductase (DIM6/NTAB) family NADH-FMN oxidoreductase RutF